jgi:hypothetical protein
LLRTVFEVARSPTESRRTSAFDKVIRFLVSVAVLLVIGTPAVVSFVLAISICLACEIHSFLCPAAAMISAVVAGLASYRLVCHAIKEWQW